MGQRIEVYMDSYSNTPIVQEIRDNRISISIGDEITWEDWLLLLKNPDSQRELKVKVEDIKHLFWDAEDLMHSVSIRVVPVD